MLTQDGKIALATGSAAAVLVAGVLVFGSSSSSPPAPVAPVAEQLATDHPADLLTAPVAPGAEIAASGDLRRGWVFTYELTLTGNARGRFEVLGIKTLPRGDGGTHLEVYAKNTSVDTVRFSAAIGYKVTPDAGVPDAGAR